MLPVVDPNAPQPTVFFTAYRAAVRLTAQACLDEPSNPSLDSLDDVSACYVRKGWREFLAASNAPHMMSTQASSSARKAPRTRFTSRSGAALDITPPFRPVDLSRFPDGTRITPIQRPDHCAILAISDALAVIHADAARFLALYPDPDQARHLLHAHARFLYELAQVGLSALTPMHLKDWHPRSLLDTPSDLSNAAQLVASMSCTEAGIASLALQWAAVAYVRALSEPPRDDESLRAHLNRQVDQFDAIRHAAFDQLLAKNENALSSLRILPRTHASQAVFRSHQHTFPVLALVPLSSPDTAEPMERSQL